MTVIEKRVATWHHRSNPGTAKDIAYTHPATSLYGGKGSLSVDGENKLQRGTKPLQGLGTFMILNCIFRDGWLAP